MGQQCGCTENNEQTERVKELEQLLAKEKDAYDKLEASYQQMSSETDELQQANGAVKYKTRIKALEKEKKQHFMEMMSEKKKIAKLEEEKRDLEQRKRNMEKALNQYERQIAEYEAREEASSSGAMVKSNSLSESASSQSRGHRLRLPVNTNASADDEDLIEDLKTPEVTPEPAASGTQYDVQADMASIKQWLEARTGDARKDKKEFNKKMTDMLTRRSDAHRLQLSALWLQNTGKTLIEAIERKLDGKTAGVPFRALSGLLQTPAELDAHWIHECCYNDWQIEPVCT